MPPITRVSTIFFLLGVSALAQQITPGPKLSDSPEPLLQHRQQSGGSSSSVNVFSAVNSCESTITGCNIQLSLYSGCDAKYGTDAKWLYCLCTTGYWDAVEQCYYCQLTKGVINSSEFALQTSLDDSNCASLSSQYGSGTASNITTSSGSGIGTIGSSSASLNVATGASSTAASTPAGLNTPSSTFVITMNGSPTAAVPSIVSTTTAQGVASNINVSSAAGYIQSSVSARLLAAAACYLGFGWTLYWLLPSRS